MTTALLNATNLNVRPPQRLVLIEENSKVDGEALISAVLGHRLSLENPGVVLVCCDHTLQHYDTVGTRWAHRIQMQRDKGTLKVFEPLKCIFQEFMDSDGKIDYLERFWFNLEKAIREFAAQGKENIAVIVDNLTFYHDLYEATEGWLVEFCLKLHQLSDEIPQLTAVIKLNECEMYELVCRQAEDYANPIIQVEPFETGVFYEVDGKLVIREKENVDKWVSKESEKTLLFKVTNRDIKVFVPGSVDIK